MTVSRKKVFKWLFFRGSDGVRPANRIGELHLSFSLVDLINRSRSMRNPLDQEREMHAGRILHQLGMDAFNIAGDQVPWLFVEEGQKNYVLNRNNCVIALDTGTEFPLDNAKSVAQLREHLGLPDRRHTLRIVVSNPDKPSGGNISGDPEKKVLNR